MENITLTINHFSSIRKMTSRQQILVYLATLTLDKSSKSWYNRVDEIQEVIGLTPGTIKDALKYLIWDGHVEG